MQKVLGSILVISSLFSSSVVVPDDYEVLEDDALTYVYGTEYKERIPHIKAYQQGVMETYEKEFGFQLDDTLRVGLATSNNQIANGFSTQVPFNSQLFYGAGASYIDYFCFSSWLKTLIIHETAHNFQLNPKENMLSNTAHTLFGNTPILFLGFFPLFPIPNITESSFILEGNAVVNESRFGNGGRLFSGYALAEVVALAKAGKITPELMYNRTLAFPYGEKFYLVGGFFQQFLVERYGIKKVNGYFKTYATQPFPFFTNSVFEEQFGESFEVLLAEFVTKLKRDHSNAKMAQGTLVATSQLFVPLNRDEDEIYTLLGDRKSAPKLLRINRHTKELTTTPNSWRVGEVFKKRGAFYTQSSAYTSPVKVEMGLFDEDGYLKEGSSTKAVQGYLHNGKEVYFDVKSSLEEPQVYVDGTFYTQSHSSVYVDGNDLYYFVQEGKKRTLFNNKTALYSFEGHYGFVTEVDKRGAVYFIGSTKHGSTVYRVEKSEVTRVSVADNIIDFKLLNTQEALVATVTATGYEYRVIKLKSALKSRPFSPKVVATDSLAEPTTTVKKSTPKTYYPLRELEYSSLTPFLSYGSYEGFQVDALASFVDPLWQNELSIIGSHNNQRDIVGARYDNSAFRLAFGGAYYKVFENNNYLNGSDRRGEGYEFYATYPWFKRGYWEASSKVAYTKDYDALFREPLTASLSLRNRKQYGVSKYANALNALTLFASDDRDTTLYGGSYTFKHDLPWQSYVGFKGVYMKSDEVDIFEEKGIELSDTLSSLQSDSATLDVPSFTFRTYAQEVKMAELSLAKVFDSSLYFYSFPLSLQRETLYAKQRRYEIDFSSTQQKSYDETRVGVEFDLLFLHNISFPLSIEWIHNKDVLDKNQGRVLIGGSF